MTPDRLVTAVDPGRVPDPWVRGRLRESFDGVLDEPAELSPWVGTGAVALLCAAAAAAYATGLGALGTALFVAAAAVVIGLPTWHLVGRPAQSRLAASRLDRWQREAHVVTARQQEALARQVPELGERLARAGTLASRLRQPQSKGGLAGVLPGIDDDVLDRIHHRIVVELMECADLAEALDEASARPNLAELVAARRAEIATVCEAVDRALDQLARLSAAAEAIADHQEETRIAERLTDEPAPVTALRLPEPASDELPDLVAAAVAALELHGLPAEVRAPDSGT